MWNTELIPFFRALLSIGNFTYQTKTKLKGAPLGCNICFHGILARAWCQESKVWRLHDIRDPVIRNCLLIIHATLGARYNFSDWQRKRERKISTFIIEAIHYPNGFKGVSIEFWNPFNNTLYNNDSVHLDFSSSRTCSVIRTIIGSLISVT